MPLFDLTRLQFKNDDSIYHHFHYLWVASIANYLNRTLPAELGLEAICEKHISPLEGDVVTIDVLEDEIRSAPEDFGSFEIPPPAATFVNPLFPDDAKDITIRTASGKIVSVIEVTSPGNKNASTKVNTYVANSVSYIKHGLNYLLIDALPPTKFVSNLHNALVVVLDGASLEVPEQKPYYAMSYWVKIKSGDVLIEVYPTWFGLGERLPTVPLFLIDDLRMGLELEPTFMDAFNNLPPRHRKKLQG